MKELRSYRTPFREILYLSIFRKCVEKIHVLLKSDKNTGILHENEYTFKITSRSFVENIKTHILCSVTFFFNCTVYEIMWKHIRAGQAKNGNMAHAHCMLDT